jgi:protein-L-isoaspartate(D-aspartate) O-methyltransferase
MPGTTTLRERLVAALVERGVLTDAAVEAAFGTVAREVFVPGVEVERVYRDEAIVTKWQDGIGVSSSSQPAIMAIMLQQLDLYPGARVLEIGAGTGYNAALIREIVGTGGQVVTVDIDAEVAGWARERLDAAGYSDVGVYCTDGADGWPAGAPYDRIELTVGAADIAPAWVEQLRVGGVLVIPLLVRAGQVSVAFEKQPDGTLRSRSVEPCGFMRIRGRLPDPLRYAPVAPGTLAGTTTEELSFEEVGTLLASAPRREPWDGGLWDGFFFFAGIWDLPLLSLITEAGATPDLRWGCFSYDMSNDRELATGLALVAQAPDDAGRRELLGYGSAAARDRLVAAFERWQAIGRPDVSALSITASAPNGAPPGAGTVTVETPRWRLTFSRVDGGAIV